MSDHTSNSNDSQQLGAQTRRFIMWDMRKSGHTMKAIGERFNIDVPRVRMELLAMEVLVRSFGEDLLNQTRLLAEMFDLEPSIYRDLLAAKVYTIEHLLEYIRTGTAPSKSYIRNIGPVTYQKLAIRLVELGMMEKGEIIPAPIPMNLPDERDWQRCLEYWGYKCAVCVSDPDEYSALHQDHWVPRCMDICPGTIVTNIVPLCKACNSEKTGRDAYSWLVGKFGKANADRKMREILDYFDWWRGQGRE